MASSPPSLERLLLGVGLSATACADTSASFARILVTSDALIPSEVSAASRTPSSQLQKLRLLSETFTADVSNCAWNVIARWRLTMAA